MEHSICRLKRYSRITDPYDGTAAQFNREFNVITGLANLNLLWDHVRKEAPPGQWQTSVDWDRALLPGSRQIVISQAHCRAAELRMQVLDRLKK